MFGSTDGVEDFADAGFADRLRCSELLREHADPQLLDHPADAGHVGGEARGRKRPEERFVLPLQPDDGRRLLGIGREAPGQLVEPALDRLEIPGKITKAIRTSGHDERRSDEAIELGRDISNSVREGRRSQVLYLRLRVQAQRAAYQV